MNFLSLGILWGLFLFLNLAQAQTELDPQNLAPKEIIVRVDQNGQAEVYKVAKTNNVNSAKSAEAAIENFVIDENKVENIVAQNELDQVTSTESWFYYYNPYFGFNYSYNYGFRYNWGFNTYNFYYRPYYNYYWGNNWYYYYHF